MVSALINSPAHELTCFYYVVRAEGITAAPEYVQKLKRLRHPPDVSCFSRAVASLEAQVGCRLIDRDPFRLLPRGAEIFETARLLVEGVGGRWANELATRRTTQPVVRCAAADFACREQLPRVEAEAERRLGIQLELEPATELEIIGALQRREVDMAVTSLNEFPVSRAQTIPLASFEPVLVVPKDTAPAFADELVLSTNVVAAAARASVPPSARGPVNTAKHFLSQAVVRELLVCADRTHGSVCAFDRDLERMGIQWPHRKIVRHTALVTNIVAHNPRVGLSLDVPGLPEHERVQLLRLLGFTAVTFGAVYLEPASKYVLPLVEIMREVAAEFGFGKPGRKQERRTA